MANQSRETPPGPPTSGGYEVPSPILNSPFEEPESYWFIQEGEQPEQRTGRRAAVVFPPRDQKREWDLSDGTLQKSNEYTNGYELVLVNLIRERVKAWREGGHYPGVTRTTLELLNWWRREDRERKLFFAQIEAVETIIFLNEARPDLLQGIRIARETISDDRKALGFDAFQRYACKMATGSGKTTVMGMVAAWSILNKGMNRNDGRFSDAIVIVCPNVTIRNRLNELKPELGEASLYRTRDLVPPHLMPMLTQGKVFITNWHTFEPQSCQDSKVERRGVEVRTKETIKIGPKNDTYRGTRQLTEDTLRMQIATGMVTVLEEYRDKEGNLEKVEVDAVRYVESDTALVKRILEKDIGNKQNILVMNDEAHHAYRIRRDDGEDEDDEEDDDDFFKEATVWMDGLDRINKLRKINFCLDLSATPYFLGRVGQDTNRPFPWIVSDFGLIDAIESGLVKVPQLVMRDTTGAEVPSYFNIWRWVLDKLTPAERGGKKGSPKPEAIIKYAHTPIAMLGGLWEDERVRWENEKQDDPRPPVFILVCKNTAIAKVMYEWLAENKPPSGVPEAKIKGFINTKDKINTIRVDSKVVHETDTGEAKGDETRWMRFTLDTVGNLNWPSDRQGRPIYPEGFEELAAKLGRPLNPPGRDIRCIISVGMLTEGWDCNTVTHIVGLRPFMSQLLCEQVVGRGLRRTNYEVNEDGKLSEEVSKVFGVPFEIIPFKASQTTAAPPKPKQFHVHAIPQRAQFEITFPRVEGYMQAIRNRITVDWPSIPSIPIEPGKIPPEVQVKSLNLNNKGGMTLAGPGSLQEVNLDPYRRARRVQELVFDLARAITRQYVEHRDSKNLAHVLFPQIVKIVQRYVDEKVRVVPPGDIKDLFLAPYYGWLLELLSEAIRPDTSQGEDPEVPRYETSRGPGSTSEVDFWTPKDVREILKSHLNYIVADTKRWEQSAAYFIDTHPKVICWAKNERLGFAIPYFHNGQDHEYRPDFIIRLKGDDEVRLILETKGYDELTEVKQAAAVRWVNAVNADGTYGTWAYALAKSVGEVAKVLHFSSGK